MCFRGNVLDRDMRGLSSYETERKRGQIFAKQNDQMVGNRTFVTLARHLF